VAGYRKSDRLVIVVILVGITALAHASFQATFRLRTEMPQGFVADSRSLPPQSRAQEEKLARAYWQCARSIQWRYGYGHRLPDDPPPEFLVTAQEVGTAASEIGSRARYWRQLQKMWYLPDNWEKTYTFDLPSLTRSLQSGGARLELWLRRVTGSSW
jgi:hypothetical protein